MRRRGEVSMAPIRNILRSRWFALLLISVAVFVALLSFRIPGFLESLELAAYDGFIRLRPGSSDHETRILLITVSEKDIQTLGRWPLTDATLAEALQILAQAGPRAIGLDIFRDISVPPGHEALDAVLTKDKDIVAVMKFGVDGVPPPPVLADTEQVGFNDIILDPGGVVRRALLFLDDGKTVYHSFALRLALLYLQAEGITPQPDADEPQFLRLGSTTIPPFGPDDGAYVKADAKGYQFLLDFRTNPGDFPRYSLTELLSGKVDVKSLKDKIVLIGVSAQSVKDSFSTPGLVGFRGTAQTAGVVLHASTVSQILRYALAGDRPLKTPGKGMEGSWIFLWSLAGGVMGLIARSPWRFSLLSLCGVVSAGGIAFVSFLQGWWIPAVPPAVTWLVSASVTTAYVSSRERRERALLMKLFSKHVSKEIAETLWQQRDQFLDGGRPRSQKVTVTCLFSDLKGFTTLSEKMDPKELIDWLNTYMESMAQLVMAHSGIVDDYAGDGLKADFGIPIPRTRDAEVKQDAIRAVQCALAMEKELVRLNALWQRDNLLPVGMRVGIFTGPAVVGLLGGSERMKYTTIGDTINTASRLESYDKDLARDTVCRILIGESTWRYVADLFVTEKVGEASLKGKSVKVAVYRVLGSIQG
jgi:adenylate cyclase